ITECLKLQGYPLDAFEFSDDVPKAKRYLHIGNSVTVPVASAIMANIVKEIKKYKRGNEL
ncbi:MAG: hypothetical protein HN757_17345, partial [Calditrichaeota bacterium]|nr:hypothetical protein [Calditrichota bacterium]